MQLLCRPIRARSQIPDIKILSPSRRCPTCCLSKRSKRQGKRRDGYSQCEGYSCVTIVKYGLSSLFMFYNDWCMYELFVNRPLALRGHVTNASFKQWVGILLMRKIDRAHKNYRTPEIWEETYLREFFMALWFFNKVVWFVLVAMLEGILLPNHYYFVYDMTH